MATMSNDVPSGGLVAQRCFRHAAREAVARCPECRRFFCRECVTEHAGRVICASCLEALAAGAPPRAGRGALLRAVLRAAGLAVSCAASALVLWMFFYWLGRTLQLLPTPFHEGTLWRELVR